MYISVHKSRDDDDAQMMILILNQVVHHVYPCWAINATFDSVVHAPAKMLFAHFPLFDLVTSTWKKNEFWKFWCMPHLPLTRTVFMAGETLRKKVYSC